VPSIELLLDSVADERVRSDWRALSAAGIPSQHDHAGASNAPHVTAAFSSTALEPIEIAVPWGAVALGGLLLFPRRRGVVLARAVVVTAELLEWHAALHAALPRDAQIDPHTAPGAWTPHITLARILPLDQLNAAVELLPAADDPVSFAAVRMWDGGTKTLTTLSR
jgi:hypothetical protein